jgi:hypothetical protein|nr:MAG TPA: hypothetical protein [Caudoviricetes sp.]
MGIYTNYTGGSVSSNYTDVQPFVGENFNYHELGIMAAAEIATNHNSFMKSIALSELAAVEQTGSTDVLYESVNIKGIFEKIKMFFKKVIEKIHKIFHTFIAKMKSWFGNNASFAKTYEKEVVKGWANVKNDWEFKGYKFTNINLNVEQADAMKVSLTDAAETIKNALSSGDIATLCQASAITVSEDGLKQVREHMDDIKESMRKGLIDGLKKNSFNTSVSASYSGGGLDSSEFTEELFKVFRNDQDSKEDISKDKILESYGGSISGMMTYIKEFDKIKSKTEAAERKLVKGIDDLIKKVDKAQNDLIKENKDKTKSEDEKKINEIAVQASSVFQTLYSGLSELTTQTFSALLQAQKDACVQAKEIAVKVIGQSKKITEESYDYSSNDNGFDFISSVKLV